MQALLGGLHDSIAVSMGTINVHGCRPSHRQGAMPLPAHSAHAARPLYCQRRVQAHLGERALQCQQRHACERSCERACLPWACRMQGPRCCCILLLPAPWDQANSTFVTSRVPGRGGDAGYCHIGCKRLDDAGEAKQINIHSTYRPAQVHTQCPCTRHILHDPSYGWRTAGVCMQQQLPPACWRWSACAACLPHGAWWHGCWPHASCAHAPPAAAPCARGCATAAAPPPASACLGWHPSPAHPRNADLLRHCICMQSDMGCDQLYSFNVRIMYCCHRA